VPHAYRPFGPAHLVIYNPDPANELRRSRLLPPPKRDDPAASRRYEEEENKKKNIEPKNVGTFQKMLINIFMKMLVKTF
jgi:hypothetical protein